MKAQAKYMPYLVGIGIGMLSWLTFAIVARPIGVTTALMQIAGWIASMSNLNVVAFNRYWQTNPIQLDYGILFLVGMLGGAFISALTSKKLAIESVPTIWKLRFGPSKIKRFIAAFIGGILVMYGARIAGGCTSGNGISQGLQLAVVGWTFFAVMFIAGLITTYLMFGTKDL